MKTYYEILDIPQAATPNEIKRAYYSAVKKFSPEHDPETFEQVKTAYEVLQDPQQRLYYDNKIKMNWVELFRYETGQIYSDQGKTGKAIKEYEKLLKMQPDNLLFMLELAHAYDERGFSNKAIAQYEKVLALNECDMDTWHAYINCLLEHDFYEKAENALRKAVELNDRFDLKNVDILVYAVLHFICIADDKIFLRKCFDMLHRLDLETATLPHATSMIINMVLTTKATDFVDDALLIGQNIKPQDYGYEQIEKLLLLKELNTFYDCNDFDEVFADLFILLIDDEGTPEERMERLGMEGYILSENPALLRKQVRKISHEYPRLFALHKTFFQNFLNEKKEESMCRTHISEVTSMLKKHPEFKEKYLSEETLEDYESLTPVRAEPKTRRNEPCPCGSGKKFKKCCGK